MKCGLRPYSYQHNVCARRGFGVLINIVIFIKFVSGDTLQLVGLGIPLCYIAKPSYSPPVTNTNVVANALRQKRVD